MEIQTQVTASCCSAKPATKTELGSVEKARQLGLATKELDLLKRKVNLCAFFAIPLVAFSMWEMVQMSGSPTSMGGLHQFAGILQLVLATPILLISLDFFRRGLDSIRFARLNMFTLLSLGICIPYVYSLIALLKGQHMLYFESSAMIATLAWLGQYLEAKAKFGTTEAIRAIADLLPENSSLLLDDGSETQVKTSAIICGDRLRLRPGEKVPVDGRVLEGACLVDESMMTGESLPVTKQSGSQIIAGTIVVSGSMDILAEQVQDATVLYQILQLVLDSKDSRVPVQQTVDKIAVIFVPSIIAIAIITFVCWYLAGVSCDEALWRAVAVLLVSCPCALGLATPVSIVTASGRAAQAGVLYKDAAAMQTLAGVDTLVIDKTGTLTQGKPVLVRSERVPDSALSDTHLWSMLVGAESKSEHPLARAIVEGLLKEPGVSQLACFDFDSMAGHGVIAQVGSKSLCAGSFEFLKGMDVDLSKLDKLAKTDQAYTQVYVACDGRLEAKLDLIDQIKPEAKTSIEELKNHHISIHIATGDNVAVALQVASLLGIDEQNVHAHLSPADKASLVARLKSAGACVAMAGDGINDAPALACANVSFAMGDGTHIAKESADIVLIKGDLQAILRALKLSEAMLANIRQNLFLAFAYNLLAIPTAAGVFVALGLGFALSPVAAAAAMSMSSIVVVVNALRLRKLPL